MSRAPQRLAALLALGAVLLIGAVALWIGLGRDGARGPGPAPSTGAPPTSVEVAAPPDPEMVSPGEEAQRSAVVGESHEALPPPAPAETVAYGRVVERATGKGVAGALVGGRHALNTALQHDPGMTGALPPNVARTDARGAFALADVSDGAAADDTDRLVAVHFDYAPAAADRPPGGWRAGGEILIQLERGPHVYGTAVTDSGEPAAGIYVRVFGEGWPRGVSATTDADGAYRTPAVRPGPIDLAATPPSGSSEAASDFTSEWKSAVVGAPDLRVDFGPDPGHVTWRGRVLDESGAPVGAGRLALTVIDSPGWADRTRKQVRRTELAKGAFELAKLRTGVTYAVALDLEGEEAALDAGTVRFDAPGVVDRDLYLAGHVIQGIVVDRDTGGPPAEGGSVYAVLHGSMNGTLGRLSEDGQFRLRGLPEGMYDLFVNAEGYAQVRREGVRVGGEVPAPDPIRVEVTRGAALTVRLVGHAPHMRFGLELEREGTVSHVPQAGTDADGAFHATYTMKPGTWTVRLNAPGVGRAVQVVSLAPGGEGEALFLPGDLLRSEGLVAVEGTLRRPDGSAVEGARLFFYGVDADLPEGDDRQRRAETDADGRFRAEGFAPGRWSVSAVLAGGAEVKFDDLSVPALPVDPVPLALVVPEGRVRGRLVDEATGAPIAADGPRWWAFLLESEGGGLVAELQGGHHGDAFELNGVPPGRFTLLLKVQGYFDHDSPPFDVGEGEARDVGEILLAPSAVLAVEAIGPDGSPIEAFAVSVAGAELRAWEAYARAPGRATWDGLVSGPATVVVSAAGMLPAERVLTFEEGAVTEARFELSPE